MDILVSSNLERLLYFAGKDEAMVKRLMTELAENGSYQIPDTMFQKISGEFWAGCCGEADTKDTIRRVWEDHGYLTDTHTAVAWNVAEQYRAAVGGDRPLVVLSTASAYKFPAAVLEALGETPDCPRKPAPDMLHRAMEHLGAERAIYVGDSEVDIATAANAGVPCVSVTWGFREEEQLCSAGAQVLCREPKELPDCIRKIERSRYGQ